MGHDEVCLICGISPSAGPGLFFVERDYANPLLANLLYEAYSPALPANTDSSLFDEIQAMRQRSVFFVPNHLQSRYNSYFERCVAIGHWDTDGYGILIQEDTHKFLDGNNIEVRYVDDYDSGWFRHTRPGSEDIGLTHCGSAEDKPCFFISECCYFYLKAWIHRGTLPVSRCRPSSLSFDGELYEIINSRNEMPAYCTGFLTCIDYDGVEDTLDQWQDYFAPHRSTKHTVAAVVAGRSGQDLLEPLLKDFGAYVFARPDLWPMPPAVVIASQITSRDSIIPSNSVFESIPVELFIQIVTLLPIPCITALSTTCRSLHSLLADEDNMNYIIKLRTQAGGDLEWLLPVPNATRDEEENASECADAWLIRYNVTTGSINKPFEHPNFPWFAFLKASWTYDCTMNRRRIHGIVKQFEKLWRDYRLNGWEVNRFVTAELH